MTGFILPILASGLIIMAAFDIYRHRNEDPRKSKRKNDEYYLDDDLINDESDEWYE